jgi:hypothetical protein
MENLVLQALGNSEVEKINKIKRNKEFLKRLINDFQKVYTLYVSNCDDTNSTEYSIKKQTKEIIENILVELKSINDWLEGILSSPELQQIALTDNKSNANTAIKEAKKITFNLKYLCSKLLEYILDYVDMDTEYDNIFLSDFGYYYKKSKILYSVKFTPKDMGVEEAHGTGFQMPTFGGKRTKSKYQKSRLRKSRKCTNKKSRKSRRR